MPLRHWNICIAPHIFNLCTRQQLMSLMHELLYLTDKVSSIYDARKGVGTTADLESDEKRNSFPCSKPGCLACSQSLR